jgi:outer membrane protein assembly factor BamB
MGVTSGFIPVPFIATVVVLAGAGCSSSHDAARPSGPRTNTETAAAMSTLSSRHVATVPVENGDGLTAVAGSIWVKTDDGRVVQIDPATNRVRRKIKVDTTSDPSQYCQGIGSDGTSVFACATTNTGTDVVVIQPATGHLVRRIKTDKTFDQLALPATPRGVWVLTGDGSTIGVIDASTGRFMTYRLGVRCQQLAARGDRVIATSQLSNAMVALDASSGVVVGRRHVTSPRMTAIAEDGSIWVDSDNGLMRLRPDLSIDTVYPDVIATAGGDVEAENGAVWVRGEDGTATKIDTTTGRQLEHISADVPLTAGSLLIAFDSIWMTSSDDGRIVRLRPAA